MGVTMDWDEEYLIDQENCFTTLHDLLKWVIFVGGQGISSPEQFLLDIKNWCSQQSWTYLLFYSNYVENLSLWKHVEENMLPMCSETALGWGLLSQFSPFRYFPHFPLLSKQKLAIEYHVYIWQVSPQLSCGDTCQMWMWFRESNRYFCEIENFAYGEISEWSFSNPHPW